MHKIFSTALALFLFVCVNCSYGQKWDKCRGKNIPGENIYKHYFGTLGGEKIVLDLRFGFCGGSNYGGSNYYFEGKEGSTCFYIGEPDSFNLNITLHGEEQPNANKLWESADQWTDRDNLARWTFKITNNTLTGTWTSADKKEKKDIRLTEDYKNSVPMDLFSYRNKEAKIWIAYTKATAAVKADEAEFIVQEQLDFLGVSRERAKTWTAYLGSLKADDSIGMMNLMPVYNENGFLVLENESVRNEQTAYTSRHSYLCLDIANKRRLTLNDVLIDDNEKLSHLLESSLRKKFNLDKNLRNYFIFEKVPVTSNIRLTEQGIYFCYDFNDIVFKRDGARPGENPLKVFLPYGQLKDLLKEDFKKRLGL